jgi:hypothetical protein
VLLLVSVVYFLGIVLDAFWRENGYQLLVGMASGTLSLVQVIVYAVRTSCSASNIFLLESLYETPILAHIVRSSNMHPLYATVPIVSFLCSEFPQSWP